jgi:hypothetical protein
MMAANQQHTGPIVVDGTTVGVHLAPNSVGQHAMGIDWLLRRIGAGPKDEYDLRTFDGHVAMSVPRWSRADLEHDEKLYLDVGPKPKKIHSTSSVLCVEGHVEHAASECRRYSPLSVITGAWDDSSFAVRGYGEDGRKVVDLVQEGIETRDLVIWLTSDMDLGHGHLCIARRSLVPEALVHGYDEEIAGYRLLFAAAAATGIAKRLEAIGPLSALGRLRPYYALSPAWICPGDECTSAHPVRFFLNPTDQGSNNFGWFTVEELDEWIAGRGPVPKNPKEGKRP